MRKYITVHPNRTVSLSEFSFFKPLHLLIRTYQIPVLLICPLALSRVKGLFIVTFSYYSISSLFNYLFIHLVICLVLVRLVNTLVTVIVNVN